MLYISANVFLHSKHLRKNQYIFCKYRKRRTETLRWIRLTLPFHKLCLHCQAPTRVAWAFEPEPKFGLFKGCQVSSGKRATWYSILSQLMWTIALSLISHVALQKDSVYGCIDALNSARLSGNLMWSSQSSYRAPTTCCTASVTVDLPTLKVGPIVRGVSMSQTIQSNSKYFSSR